MASSRRTAKSLADSTQSEAGRDTELRIIGGHFRGRKLRYHGDPVVRPMKHRVREAIFNLISTESAGHHVIDLFAGTGALGLEALSRGATSATFIEKHVPILPRGRGESGGTRRRRSGHAANHQRVPVGQARSRFRHRRPAAGFAVARVLQSALCVLRRARGGDAGPHRPHRRVSAPANSTIVIESDQQFDFGGLVGDNRDAWDLRDYPPARVGIWRLRCGGNQNGERERSVEHRGEIRSRGNQKPRETIMRKQWVGAVAGFGLLLVGGWCEHVAISQENRLETSPRHLEWVDVEHGDRKVKCFVAYPEVPDKAQAVIVIHEIFGLTDWVRGVADQLAEAGYIAIAPDLLSGMGPDGGGTDSFGGGDGVRGEICKLAARADHRRSRRRGEVRHRAARRNGNRRP